MLSSLTFSAKLIYNISLVSSIKKLA